ncbi:hypothetical protein EV175_006462 [Coemansia sp. RSA 1933]|nr:hypothetical protein EV175_006462 [Coemansia sp. RSA 1933]
MGGDGAESSGQRVPAPGAARSLSLSTGSEVVHKPVMMAAETAAGGGGGNANSRRRTMDVPPSLMEGVATSSFGSSVLNRVPSIPPPPSGSGGSIIRGAPGLQTPQHYQQLTSERNGASGYPPRPSSGTLRPVDGGGKATRVRRSLTIGNQNYNGPETMAAGVPGRQQQQQRIGGGSAIQTLPSVSEATTAQLLQFPHVSETMRGYQQNPDQHSVSAFGSLGTDSTGLGVSGTSGTRHGRTHSGPQLTQEAMSALADASPGILASFRLHDGSLDFGLSAGHTATSQQQHQFQHPKPVGESSSLKDGDDSIDVDLEAMTTLSAGCVGSIDFSSTFKPYLWTATGLGEDGMNGASTAVVEAETQSLVDVRRGGDASSHDTTYRPASSTPTGGRRYLGIGGSNAASESTPTVSPVAPRSAASTPGRREVVEI